MSVDTRPPGGIHRDRRLLRARVLLSAICTGAVGVGVTRSVSMALGDQQAMPMPGTGGTPMPAQPLAGAVHPLSGMPLTAMPEMFVAALAVVGVVVVAGVASRGRPASWSPGGRRPSAALRRAQLVACTVALSIDVSKTSSLGFVIPGMRAEYGLSPSRAALLAVAGLSGTLLGASLIRTFGHRWARQDVYLVGALGFTSTSACGMMPSFGGNLVMCLLMGMSVGGLAPLLVGCLRDLSPSGPRSALMVGLALVSSALGFLVASGAAAWLEPRWGWRAIWLVGAPTGLVLLLATPLFAVVEPSDRVDVAPTGLRAVPLGWQYAFAVLAGIVAFGVSTWTPTLARRGVDPGQANLVLVLVSTALVPLAVLLGWVYRRHGAGALNAGLVLTLCVTLVALLGAQLPGTPRWFPAVALAGTLFAVNAMSAVLMPVAADSVTGVGRTQAASTLSMFNRLGGLTGPLVLALLVTSTPRMLAAVAAMALACGLAGLSFGRLGRDTRSRSTADVPGGARTDPSPS